MSELFVDTLRLNFSGFQIALLVTLVVLFAVLITAISLTPYGTPLAYFTLALPVVIIILTIFQPIIDNWNAPRIRIDYNVADLQDGKIRRFNFWVQNWGRKSAKEMKVEFRFEGFPNKMERKKQEWLEMKMIGGGFVLAENCLLPPMRDLEQRFGFAIDFEIYYDTISQSFVLAWMKEARDGDDITLKPERRGAFPSDASLVTISASWNFKDRVEYYEKRYWLREKGQDGRPTLKERRKFQ